MLRVVCTYIVVNIVIAGLLILSNGIIPKTYFGWVYIFALSFPIYLLSEYLGSNVISDSISHLINNKPNLISSSRIVYGLLIGIIYIILVFSVYQMLKPFWEKHFVFL